ncbi:unnamed protein product [Durusdinium trenchii]|uniref:Pentatricopeptide repeat-containing protein n=1 Tax=Durusdinium trenchii TaxID=1381693 RepID=A0ABP0SMY6_9DINO
MLLWSQMPFGMANVRTFNAAISACATSAQPDVSFLLLQQMSAMVLTPDVISYSAAVHACEKGWRWKDALHLLNIMVSRSTAPNLITLNSAIAACDKAGEWQQALRLILGSKSFRAREIESAFLFCNRVLVLFFRSLPL